MTERFTLVSATASELPIDRREPAVREVASLVQLVAHVVDRIEPQHEIELDVVLVKALDAHVDRIMKEHGRCDAVGSYRSTRNTVVAQAITLRDPRQSHVRATIVMDHRYWLADVGDIRLIRAHLLVHELGHILQQACETSIGWRRHQEPLRSYEETIRRAAVILWEEFDADVFSFRICREICQRTDGTSISFASAFGQGFLQSAKDLLEKLCAFAQEDVQTYRRTGDGLEGLYPKAASIVGELLLVLAHASPAYQVDGTIEELTTTLQAYRGFAAYLADDWEVFLTELSDKVNASDAEDQLRDIIDRVLRRLGLELEDVDEGMFVGVGEPVLCPPANDSSA